MTAWILTRGLQTLRAQVDAVFPGRDKTSDGTIGDAAHQGEISSHNPDDTPGSKPEWNGDPDNIPEVRAWDMDNNLSPDLDCQVFVDHLRSLPGLSSVIRYMIYNRKIYRAQNNWAAEAYTGPSAHTEHVHFTGAFTQAADNNTTFNYRLEEIPVAMTAADRAWIAQQNADLLAAVEALTKSTPLKDDGGKADGTFTSPVGAKTLGQGRPDATLPKDAHGDYPRQADWVATQNATEVLMGVKEDVAAIRTKVGA